MKRPILVSAIWGFVLYLGLFSGFALLHAYGQDELADPHGCVIGAWVQHAHATEAAAPPLATLVCLHEFFPSTHDLVVQSAIIGQTSRGPPYSAR